MSVSPQSSPGNAVPGTSVPASSLVTPGGAQGVAGPTNVSADAGNIATFGTDNKIYVPDPVPTIYSTRLRSYNSIGNPNFEVDQKNCYGSGAYAGGGVNSIDRWLPSKAGTTTLAATAQVLTGNQITVPGTNFAITRCIHRTTLTAAQATLAAGDLLWLNQAIEGCVFRELYNDVHSISILVRSSVAALKFGVALRDPTAAISLTKLCTLGAANTWTLIQLPNIPSFVGAGGGTWSNAPGAVGYQLSITLAGGATYTSSANDVWISGNLVAAPGQSNFGASPVNSTFDIAFVQHEPGAICSQLMDLDFDTNLRRCKRYYAKANPYGNLFPTSSDIRQIGTQLGGTTTVRSFVAFEVEMAKAPTVTLADNAVATGKIYLDAPGSVLISGIAGLTARGIGQITLNASQNSAGQYISALGQWQADTGW